MSDAKSTTDFGTESKAASVIAAAKMKRIPVGGAPIHMPRFDQPPPAQQQAGIQAVRSAQRVLTPEEKNKLIERGQFQPGVGSGYAINQPAMGHLVEQNEEDLPIDPKLAPRPPGSGLRPETVKDLEAVAAANAAKQDPGDKELTKINKEIEEIDEVFETNEFGERVRSLLGNKERARAIESRCKPLALEDLLLYGSIKQVVPIVPGKFEPTFRSLHAEESVEILRLIGLLRGSEEYVMDMLQLYRLTAGLYSLNTKILPDHLDKSGDFNEDLFKAKNKIIMKMAVPIIADMSVNFGWFSRRVQKLTVIDDIKSF